MCGADCWTGHRLIVSKFKFLILPKRRPQGKKTLKRLNVAELSQHKLVYELITDLDGKLHNLQIGDATIKDDWASLKEAVYATTFEHLGPTQRKNQDWFDVKDAEITALHEKKHRCHRTLQDDPTSSSKKAAFDNIRQKVQAMHFTRIS